MNAVQGNKVRYRPRHIYKRPAADVSTYKPIIVHSPTRSPVNQSPIQYLIPIIPIHEPPHREESPDRNAREQHCLGRISSALSSAHKSTKVTRRMQSTHVDALGAVDKLDNLLHLGPVGGQPNHHDTLVRPHLRARLPLFEPPLHAGMNDDDPPGRILVHFFRDHAELGEDGEDALRVEGKGFPVARGHAQGGRQDPVGEVGREGLEQLGDGEGFVPVQQGTDCPFADLRDGVFVVYHLVCLCLIHRCVFVLFSWQYVASGGQPDGKGGQAASFGQESDESGDIRF